jgi:hypothetical protein
MGWDRKRRGPASGYFYLSKRLPDKVHPVKICLGRGAAGQEAAAAVEQRLRERKRAKAAVRAERDATAEGDRLAEELHEWAVALSTVWLVLSGLHNHRGSWRVKRDQST